MKSKLYRDGIVKCREIRTFIEAGKENDFDKIRPRDWDSFCESIIKEKDKEMVLGNVLDVVKEYEQDFMINQNGCPGDCF